MISPDDDLEHEPPLTFHQVDRPWLARRGDELTFDADRYAATLDYCSDYTRHMRLWILNIWNSSYAKSKGWHFDLFKALNGLDDGNRAAIAWHLKHPIWP